MRTRVGVFGGSFDPPHRGHQLVVTQLLAHHLVDEVWFLPVKMHPFGKQVSADKHRLALLQAVVDDIADKRVRIETFELETTGPNYTYSTLQALAAREPHSQLVWIMGSDLLVSFSQWYCAAELLRDFEVVVYPRAGYGWSGLDPAMHALVDWPAIEISSTQVRHHLANHQQATQLVLPEVAEYSNNHYLYTKP